MARPMPRSVLLAPLALLAANACGGASEASTPTAVTRDSAGITIVENDAPVWDTSTAWRLSSEPALRIGTFEGEDAQQLFQVRDAVRLSDGRVVIANGGSRELRYFDAAGNHLLSVGRQGGGPGEFQFIASLTPLPGDSVVVLDLQQRRQSLFDSQGRHVRDVSIAPSGAALVQPLGRFPDGTSVAQGSTRQPGRAQLERPTGRDRDSLMLVRLDTAGAVLDTIGTFANRRVLVTTVQMGGRGFPFPVTEPFTPWTSVAVTPTALYVGTSDTYEVRVFDLDGALRRLVRRAHEPRAVTQADIAENRTRMEEAMSRQGDNPIVTAMRDVYATIDYPDVHPAYIQIRADRDGNLWVADVNDPDADDQRWTVFDTGGTMLGTVAMPGDFRVTDIGSDYVLGTVTDDLEVEYVLLYDLNKPRR